MDRETAIKYFGESWAIQLSPLLQSQYFADLEQFILLSRHNYYTKVLPPAGSGLMFKSFRVTPYNNVKICLLGQDIYHTPNAYDGLAFSNSTLDRPQPSLANILKEVNDDVGVTSNLLLCDKPWNLYRWAEQGVLLINVAHTVLEGKPGGHLKWWIPFTEFVIHKLNEKDLVIWIFLGNFARSFKKYITNKKHIILEAPHPSPFSAHKGFFGSRIFSKCNQHLINNQLEPIIW